MKSLKVDLGNRTNLEIISIRKGEMLKVWYMLSILDNSAEVKYVDDGPKEVTFREDSLAVVEKFNPRKGWCKHIRFARRDRRARGLAIGQTKSWPRLRKALQQAELPKMVALGGFDNCLTYADEMAVCDFSMSGSGGWIIPKRDIGRFLDALPPEPEIPGDLIMRFQCRECGRSPKIGFVVTRRGSHNKVWSIHPVEGWTCECGEIFSAKENYDVITMNGYEFTGEALVRMENPDKRDAKEQEWLNEPPATDDPDPWTLAISAGYPINDFGYGGAIVPRAPRTTPKAA